MKPLHYALALAAAFTFACDDADPDPAAADGGMAANADAETPPENFIPINDDRCDTSTEAALDSARTALNRIEDYDTHAVVEGLELCDDGAFAGCGACPDNPLGDLIDAIDASGDFVEYTDNIENPEPSMRAYWAAALSYPVRELILSTRSGPDGRAALAQAVQVPVSANDVRYALQAETLLESCAGPAHLYSGLDDANSVATEPSDVSFGFLIPLVEELPPVDAFGSLEAVTAWATSAQNMAVSVEQPSLQIDRGGDLSCMMMTGYVSIDALARDLGEEVVGIVAEGGFEDARYPGYVRGTIRGRLVDVAVYNGAPPAAGIGGPSSTLFTGEDEDFSPPAAPACTHDLLEVEATEAMDGRVDLSFEVTRTCQDPLDLQETAVMIIVEGPDGRALSMTEMVPIAPAGEAVQATVSVMGVPASGGRARLFASNGDGWSETRAWIDVPVAPGTAMAP